MDLSEILTLYPPYTSVLGPYYRNDGRQHIILNDNNKSKGEKGKTKTISYPKALMEIHLGYKLEADDTVDHIDGDFNNNNLSNLQVLNRKNHATKDVKRVKYSNLVCQWCGKEFIPTVDQMNNKKLSPKFCSRQCVGKYGAAVQNGKISPLQGQNLSRDYYTNRYDSVQY